MQQETYENQYCNPPNMVQMSNYRSNENNFQYNGKKIENNPTTPVLFNQKPMSQPKQINKIPVVVPNNQENLEEMSLKHEQLINTILTDEEEVISMHRKHIDDMVEAIKQVDFLI